MTERNRFAELIEQAELGDEPLGSESEIIEGPVSDFATDFDHTDERWANDPYPIMADLRQRCPIAHTDRYGGAWLPTRHDDVAAIAYDTERFSSRTVILGNHRPPRELAPVGIAPPISSDPPYHHDSRRLLLPAFAPKAIAALEAGARQYCNELLDALEGRDVIDAATEFAQHIPVRVIADMLGFPPEDGDLFRGFINELLEGINRPVEERFDTLEALFGYLAVQMDDHVDHPRDDLTSYLLQVDVDGRKLDQLEVTGTMGLLLVAGIDTTWSAIGSSIWHLATHPDDRQRLVADPDLLPLAMEELLRAYAPVTMARLVKDDMEWNGCPMKAEDWILLSFPAANRDPSVFEDADRVVIDREVNRHAAFGLGIHRCIGSHLARMELRVALETWLARFPQFSLPEGATVSWSGGQVRGPRSLPIRIDGYPG